ncbi:hypothetical protein [Cupriavidus campinensis]|uniref:hypothetical protein n=1 Tax=Cupriavidus campinensis TaxID=151783 RepID=UPI0011ED74FD|nr:hypothetical protein [Cupriavidus campinensis]
MAAPDPYEEHSEAKRNIAQAKRKVLSALETAWPNFYQDPPAEEVSSDSCRKLSHLQIGMGVRAMALACNLHGGSTGDVDIYRLMQAYLWDRDARQQINEIVGKSWTPSPDTELVQDVASLIRQPSPVFGQATPESRRGPTGRCSGRTL